MFDNSIDTYLIILLTVLALQILFFMGLGATLVYVHRIQLRYALVENAKFSKEYLETMFGDDEDDDKVDPLDSHFETAHKD